MGILLAVLCGVAWSALDILRKSLGQRVDATTAAAGLFLFQVPFAAVMLVYGSAYSPLFDTTFLTFSLSSVVLNVFAATLFLRAVQISPLGLTVPYLSFTPVFTALTGWLFLDEAIPTQSFVGIVLVLCGAFLLNPPKTKDGKFNPIKPLLTERGSLFMVVVSALWSFTPILDKRATEIGSIEAHTFMLSVGVFLVLAAMTGVRKRDATFVVRSMRPAFTILVIAGALNFVAMYFQMWSYEFTEVAYVETVKRAIGVTSAIVAGYFLFSETEWRKRVPGAVLMIIGVGLVVINL